MPRLGSEVSIESVEAPGSQGAARAKYRVYSTEAQRSEAGCIGARMQHDFRDGTLVHEPANPAANSSSFSALAALQHLLQFGLPA